MHLCAGTPQLFQVLIFLFALLCCRCAAVSCLLYYTVPHALNLYYVAATVQQQSHSEYVRTTYMRVMKLHMRGCDVCVAFATTAAVIVQVNNSTQQEFLLTYQVLLALLFSMSNNTAAHVPCFLQHKL